MPHQGSGPGRDDFAAVESVPLCRHCNDVLGFYEPIVLLVDGQPPRPTSRAASPLAAEHVAFHRDCFRQSRAGPGPGDL